jgi:hypothetical protein
MIAAASDIHDHACHGELQRIACATVNFSRAGAAVEKPADAATDSALPSLIS